MRLIGTASGFHRKHGDRCGNDKRKRVQREESLWFLTGAVSRVLSIKNDDGTAAATTDDEDRNPPSKREETTYTTLPQSQLHSHIATLKHPNTMDHTPIEMDGAARLILNLEQSFRARHTGCLTRREVTHIGANCNGCIGEMEALTLERLRKEMADGEDGVRGIWCQRCPGLRLERLALLYRCGV